MKAPDEAEFTEFATTTIRRLRRTAYLMCGDWHRAEDAAQDALVKVYRHWHRIDRAPAGPLPDPGTAVDDRMFVVQALGALPPSQRACVVLRHYADLSIEQTADILGIGPGGVKSQTSRGLARLRELLDQTERSAS